MSTEETNSTSNENISQQKDGQTPPHVDDNYNRALVISSTSLPVIKFKNFVVGGPHHDQKYTKEKLKLFAKIAKTQPLEKVDPIWNGDNPKVTFRVQDYKEAIVYAVQATTADETRTCPRLVMFVDGSSKGRWSSIGLTYKRLNLAVRGVTKDGWTDIAYGVHGIRDNQAAEILGVHRSLWTAYYEMMSWKQEYPNPNDNNYKYHPRVFIFTDCVGAINYIHYCHYRSASKLGFPPNKRLGPRALPNDFHRWALEPVDKILSLGISVEINWTPGHVGIEGNTRADALASFAAYFNSVLSSVYPNSAECLIPAQDWVSIKKRRILSPIHRGNAVIDLKHWQSDRTRQIMERVIAKHLYHNIDVTRKEIVGLIRGKPPPDTKQTTGKKRKAIDIAVGESDIADSTPPTKKLKPHTEKSHETDSQPDEKAEARRKNPPIRGLICWKE